MLLTVYSQPYPHELWIKKAAARAARFVDAARAARRSLEKSVQNLRLADSNPAS
jgi:hypothetical protein